MTLRDLRSALAAAARSFTLAAALAAALAGCSSVPPAPPAPPPPPEESVKPGINKDFLDPALDIAKYEQRVEVESREVFAQRERVVALLGLRPGMAVADIGAGTGLYTLLFAPLVGPKGRVFAVDIAKNFVDHLRAEAAAAQLPQIEPVLCTERSVELPPASVDLAFVCDTYHHFEFPRSTLASLRTALRPGGELVILDFIREPGVSSEWILGHVRASEAVVRQEIEAAGFEFVRREETPYLRENYVLRFRRP